MWVCIALQLRADSHSLRVLDRAATVWHCNWDEGPRCRQAADEDYALAARRLAAVAVEAGVVAVVAVDDGAGRLNYLRSKLH